MGGGGEGAYCQEVPEPTYSTNFRPRAAHDQLKSLMCCLGRLDIYQEIGGGSIHESQVGGEQVGAGPRGREVLRCAEASIISQEHGAIKYYRLVGIYNVLGYYTQHATSKWANPGRARGLAIQGPKTPADSLCINQRGRVTISYIPSPYSSQVYSDCSRSHS